ncbi:MAG: hypothetical protein LBO06_01435 [Bacteroidales bacterium]|nr:hypothetical protein [Bacteroidales bacterium]
MKKLLFLSVAALCCMSHSCVEEREGHHFITVKNNGNDTIVCVERWQGRIEPDDTLYPCHIGGLTILPNNQREFEAGDEVWEEDFKIIPFIQFFIINDSIYKNIPCDTIRKYNMILHHYKLTLEDLQRMNWVVDYPPK